MPAVTVAQIGKAQASNGRIAENAAALAAVCTQVGYPYFLACAILEKESHGRNVYGHDVGGAMAGFPAEVTADNYVVFTWLRTVQGMKSNGVGPMQITWPGHFTAMDVQCLEPWRPRDNIQYGVQVLHGSHAVYRKRGLSQQQSFWESARDYNGAEVYADDAVSKAKWWATTVGTTDQPTYKF